MTATKFIYPAGGAESGFAAGFSVDADGAFGGVASDRSAAGAAEAGEGRGAVSTELLPGCAAAGLAAGLGLASGADVWVEGAGCA